MSKEPLKLFSPSLSKRISEEVNTIIEFNANTQQIREGGFLQKAKLVVVGLFNRQTKTDIINDNINKACLEAAKNLVYSKQKKLPSTFVTLKGSGTPPTFKIVEKRIRKTTAHNINTVTNQPNKEFDTKALHAKPVSLPVTYLYKNEKNLPIYKIDETLLKNNHNTHDPKTHTANTGNQTTFYPNLTITKTQIPKHYRPIYNKWVVNWPQNEENIKQSILKFANINNPCNQSIFRIKNSFSSLQENAKYTYSTFGTYVSTVDKKIGELTALLPTQIIQDAQKIVKDNSEITQKTFDSVRDIINVSFKTSGAPDDIIKEKSDTSMDNISTTITDILTNCVAKTIADHLIQSIGPFIDNIIPDNNDNFTKLIKEKFTGLEKMIKNSILEKNITLRISSSIHSLRNECANLLTNYLNNLPKEVPQKDQTTPIKRA